MNGNTIVWNIDVVVVGDTETILSPNLGMLVDHPCVRLLAACRSVGYGGVLRRRARQPVRQIRAAWLSVYRRVCAAQPLMGNRWLVVSKAARLRGTSLLIRTPCAAPMMGE